MSIKRLFDAVERRGDIGRRVAALVLPISNRPRVTSSGAGKISLREPGEHTSGPNLASRDNVAHNETLSTILETQCPLYPRKRTNSRLSRDVGLVPKADSCTAAKPPIFDRVIGDREALGLTIPRPQEPQCDLLAGLAS